jgi:hypothetical protein
MGREHRSTGISTVLGALRLQCTLWRRRNGVLTRRAADFGRGGDILRRLPLFQFSASGFRRILRRLRTCAIGIEGSNLVTTPQYFMPSCTSERLHGRRLALCGVVFVIQVHNLNSYNHEEAMRDDEFTPYPFWEHSSMIPIPTHLGNGASMSTKAITIPFAKVKNSSASFTSSGTGVVGPPSGSKGS